MNLLQDDIGEIAHTISVRIASRGGTWQVFVRTDGKVAMDRVGDNRRARELPEADMVGTYSKAAPERYVHEDLAARRAEIDTRSEL